MKKLAARILPILGFLFITAYIRSATVDVVYTDYIRIVNSYLPDVWSIKPYLRPDILMRVPISYIERIINTKIFGYSTTFEMFLGAAGLTLSAFVLTSYTLRRGLKAGAILAILAVVFSLDKWEMLTNGTGWMHFWAFALFYLHYDIYDRSRGTVGAESRSTGVPGITDKGGPAAAARDGQRCRSEKWLRILPFVTIFLFSGPYCAIYAGAMGIIYVIDYFTGNYDRSETLKKDWIWRMICLAVPFLLFCLSKFSTPEEYAGATNETFTQVIKSEPMILPKMVLKSFASMVIGGETAMEYGIGNKVLYLMGIFVIAAYAYAIWLNIKSGFYRKTAFPMLLIISGLVSHAIVISGRWIFKSPDYMMSSRYALQYQSGIIGIILSLCLERRREAAPETSTVPGTQVSGTGVEKTGTVSRGAGFRRAAVIIFLAVIICGRFVTTGREINMAKYRKAAFENVRAVALNYEKETDETLKAILQYSKPDMTRRALKILQDGHLNIFR